MGMVLACPHEKCTGCATCVNSCPRNAIRMERDAQGFDVPIITEDLCVSCGKCNTICPAMQLPIVSEPQDVYAMLAKDDALRDKSSSGGIFSLLARDVIKKGGIVYGAAFTSDWRVCHTSATTEEELEKLRTSKYVQSDIGLTYREVKTSLQQHKQVLFVGTPCQVDGLHRYLGKEHDLLLTADLVCHGAPSPGVFSRWIESEIEEHGAIRSVNFRKKVHGWKTFRSRIDFENGDTVDCKQNEGYVGGFLQNLYLRESCYTCSYARTARTGDITLGDYWRYQETKPERIEDDDRGISLVMVNTNKGQKVLKRIRSKVALAPRTIDDAMRGNPVLKSPATRSERYDEFWKDYDRMSWSDLMETYVPATEEPKDDIHPADREYYAMPYSKRHRKHLMHCLKLALINRLKKR